jgi:2-oxoglutarate dehydrogenase E2 component (dihydrolipoamide succinyltransferase)
MAVEIRVPTLGESVVEATVARWHKREGDQVAADDVVVELETDKVNVEVLAPASGVLEHIARHEGDTVGVNEVLASVAALAGADALNPVPVAVPAEAVAPAETAEDGHGPLATPVAEKMAAERGLKLTDVKGSGANGKITIDDVRTHLERSGQPGTVATAEPIPAVAAVATPASARSVTPVAETITSASPAPTLAQSPTPNAQRPTPSLPVSTPKIPEALLSTALNRREEREPMSRLRKTIAARLVEAQHTAAMLTTFNEVDMTAIMEVRKRRRDSFKERYGVGLGFMSFFTKASIGALKAFPNLNAEIQDEVIVRKFYYDIGIAVGTEKGLVVPVVRDADRKTFAEIEKDIAGLAQRARDGKLTLPELLGGTFTLTNGGIYGSLMSTPILNAPQVGILGMHKIQERPMVVNGEIKIRPMMYLALSYDHRIVDGSEAVRFLVRIKELLEDPESLLLEG